MMFAAARLKIPRPVRAWPVRWLGAWLLLSAGLLGWLSQQSLRQHQDRFDTDARIAHRLLSQRAVQHDAVLATLALLHPVGNRESDDADALRRLPAVYPQILRVASRTDVAVLGREVTAWPAGPSQQALARAEMQSRRSGHAELAEFDPQQARFWVVQAAVPVSYALHIDARTMVPWNEWPIAADSPVQTALRLGDQGLILQAGHVQHSPWQYSFHKRLATDSQPFEVVLSQTLPWSALPWRQASLGAVAIALGLTVLAALLGQRRERRRVEDLLRLGQVSRLNAMGELAAGMAHELNQPLTAVLANTQAAVRLLADEPPELDTARLAMDQAVQQARRASEVVIRLRRTVERPELAAAATPVRLDEAARNALYLIEPECRRLQVQAALVCSQPVVVQADPVALEQVIHNLLSNALQAIERAGVPERRLVLHVVADHAMGRLEVQDSGPGIADEARPHVFEPFFSTREGGLGLGLSLCESLVQGMGGQLRLLHEAPAGTVPERLSGAAFELSLPLASGTQAKADAHA